MINPKTKEAYQLLHEGTLALARAEQQGIRVDMDYCEKKKQHLTRKIQRLEDKFKETKFFRHWNNTRGGKVNIYSNDQLAKYLYNTKGLEPAYTTTSGQGATDEEALKQLQIPELNDLLAIRKLRKVRDTYLEAFMREQVGGYVHPSFNLHLVQTFRSSSDRPNFQNIPKRDKEAMQITRKALFPRPGNMLLEVDYGALEVKIAACYHQDPTMMKYLHDPTTDMHGDMAQQIFKIKRFDKAIPSHDILRKAAKNGFVFPEFYGDYYKNCAVSLACNWAGLPKGRWKKEHGMQLTEDKTIGEHLIENGIRSLDQFTDHIKGIEDDFWGKRFPVYKRWKEKWWRAYQKNGYIDMLTGFRCSGIMRMNEAINYPVQGAAFHCLLWSFIQLDKHLRENNWNSRLIGQIHDAIVMDVDPNELDDLVPLLQKVMVDDLKEAWPWINVPLNVEVDIGEVDGSWEKMETLLK